MALEGIKQGANLWFGLNRGAWLKLGARTSIDETNLYYIESIGVRVGVFADDTLVGFKNEHRSQYLRLKSEYAKIIKIGSSDTISPALRFTGVQIERDRQRRLLTIHQERYIEQLGEQYKEKIFPQETPYGSSKEARLNFDKLLENKESKPVDKGEYLQLMGKLVWPSACTRPDISGYISVLCSRVSDPRECHYQAGLVVIGYLVSTKRLGITYGGEIRVPYGLSKIPVGFVESNGLYTAHDSSWGTRPSPLGGYVIMYNNGAIDWSAKLVKIVPDSSCEAETAVGSIAAKGTCFIRALVRFHRRPVAASTPMLGDNVAMHTNITQEGATARTRYYERATQLIKRAVLMLILDPYLVSTHYMLADIFTKAVEKSTFVRLRNTMMNVHANLRIALADSGYALHGAAARIVERMGRWL